MTIKQIKDILEETKQSDKEEINIILKKLETDERMGVKKLVEHYKKWYNNLEAEKDRLDGLLFFERKFAYRGLVCGVDEAGAGPLAGPLAAAAVILPANCAINSINDSKKLSSKLRAMLYDEILDVAIAHSIVFIDNNEIDKINILQARLKAMAMAVNSLEPAASYALVDGERALAGIASLPIQGGDSKSMSIAAASILAKVARDRLMDEYDKIYPQYGFMRHKGYGTSQHMEAIKAHGPSPIHRKTFIRW